MVERIERAFDKKWPAFSGVNGGISRVFRGKEAFILPVLPLIWILSAGCLSPVRSASSPAEDADGGDLVNFADGGSNTDRFDAGQSDVCFLGDRDECAGRCPFPPILTIKGWAEADVPDPLDCEMCACGPWGSESLVDGCSTDSDCVFAEVGCCGGCGGCEFSVAMLATEYQGWRSRLAQECKSVGVLCKLMSCDCGEYEIRCDAGRCVALPGP